MLYKMIWHYNITWLRSHEMLVWSDRGLLQRAPPHGRLRWLREVSPSSPCQAASATPSQMCPSTPATPPTPERQQPDPWGGSRPVCRWSEQKLVQSPQKVQCWPLCAGSGDRWGSSEEPLNCQRQNWNLPFPCLCWPSHTHSLGPSKSLSLNTLKHWWWWNQYPVTPLSKVLRVHICWDFSLCQWWQHYSFYWCRIQHSLAHRQN